MNFKSLTLSASFLFIFLMANAQPCPTGHLVLSSQSAIDNFAINYPGCTTIPEGMTIEGSNITSLQGLSQITDFNGDLIISFCDALTNLDGLGGITQSTFIGIFYNTNLTSITGLSGIVPGSVELVGIEENPQLSVCNEPFICNSLALGVPFLFVINNAPGCNTNEEIIEACGTPPVCPPGDLIINSQQDMDDFAANYPNCIQFNGNIFIENSDVVNLTGLESILYINGNVSISGNHLLSDLSGLENMQSLNGNLEITSNEMLTDLSGLNTFSLSGPYSISITNNASLAACNEPYLCSYLDSNYSINVTGNAPGCATLLEFVNACGYSFICPEGELYFISQEAINNFAINYPGCTAIDGNVYIQGADIVDLSPLSIITDIAGRLHIRNNNLLTSLHGIENMADDANGFNIHNNPLLTDIAAMSGFDIPSNYELRIYDNPLLAVCDYDNICSYLSTGNNSGYFVNNVNTCNGTQLQLICLNGAVCPEGDLVINSDADVTFFAMAYPNCTTISGSVYVQPDAGVTSLWGLGNIETIEGNLHITHNNSFVTLGLENLRTVGGNIKIEHTSLEDLSGFLDLFSVGGYFKVAYNDDLKSFDGMEYLLSVGKLKIDANPLLNDIQTLQSLAYVNGYIKIRGNNSLESLHGLQYVFPENIEQLDLSNNPLLEYCAMNNICTYLSSDKPRIIMNNAGHCESELALLETCNDNPCGGENIVLSTQQEVDDFPMNYPGCTLWDANIEINGLSITHLDSLYPLVAINGNLRISNTSINSLSGLEDIHIVKLDLQLKNNDNLISVEALPLVGDSLIIVGNDLLSECTIEAVCRHFRISPRGFVENNAEDCGNSSYVSSYCTSLREVCTQISSSSGDVEEDESGEVDLNSTDLEMSEDNGSQKIALRFRYHNLNQGYIIEKANITFTTDQTDNINPCELQIYGELSVAPEFFSNTPFNISERIKTNASVTWTPDNWTEVGASGAAQQTIDISPVLQEIVNLENFNSNYSAIVIIIEGTGKRTADSFDGNPDGAAELCVSYLKNPVEAAANAGAYNNKITNQTPKEDFKIFPNPTADILHLVFSEENTAHYELRDMAGTLISQNNFNSATTINLIDLPKGIYSLLLQAGDRRWMEKVVKL